MNARGATLRLGAPVEVVATQAHAVALAGILAGRDRVPVLAELLVEPHNPVGVQVVGVYVAGQMVGRLPRDAAESRREELLAAIAAQGAAVVDAEVRAGSYPLVTLEPAT